MDLGISNLVWFILLSPYTQTGFATNIKVGCLVIGFFSARRLEILGCYSSSQEGGDKWKNTAKLNISMSPRFSAFIPQPFYNTFQLGITLFMHFRFVPHINSHDDGRKTNAVAGRVGAVESPGTFINAYMDPPQPTSSLISYH
ncbi:hypothetical protein BGX38DRAFT_870065 [Terfezia claveryi]|nr:hypothetical protein BGX38DRAFT_870065 [Terfezia claveryi]